MIEFRVGVGSSTPLDMQKRIKKKAKKFAFQMEKGVQTGYRHYQGRMSLRKKIPEGPL